jgi:hypothetical protein
MNINHVNVLFKQKSPQPGNVTQRQRRLGAEASDEVLTALLCQLRCHATTSGDHQRPMACRNQSPSDFKYPTLRSATFKCWKNLQHSEPTVSRAISLALRHSLILA